MHAADSIFKDGRGFGRAAPSSLTREKTNIWSLLILLNRGATEAKAVKNACVGTLEMQRQPHAGRWDPPQIQLFPGNSNPSPHPPSGSEKLCGCKSQVAVKQFTIQLTQITLLLQFCFFQVYNGKRRSLNWQRNSMKRPV